MAQNNLLDKKSINQETDPNVRQENASNPDHSVWVGASAGSGKTKVLTDRVLRLLLPNKNGLNAVNPSKILALTFTKAAANEMALRINEELGKWAVINIDDKGKVKGLKSLLKSLLGQAPTDSQIKYAQQLFAKVIDVPGGLKIMTIHSFCTSILGRFPLEAGLSPNFKAIEENESAPLLQSAMHKTIIQCQNEKGSDLAHAFYNLALIQNEEQIFDLIKKMVSERRQIQKILDENFGAVGLYTALCQFFDIDDTKTADDIIADACQRENYDGDNLREAGKALSQGSPSKDVGKSIIIQKWLDSDPIQKFNYFDEYQSAFLKKDGDIFNPIAQKTIQNKFPHIEEILLTEATRLQNIKQKLSSLKIATSTRDLFLFGGNILDRYAFLKKQKAYLDYDDLILITLNLLTGQTETLKNINSVSPWIRYKLDQGIDHILVDEAQDTNPEQWDIIRALTDDFTNTLEGEPNRTVFVVGDEKQSIYSFQRASPEKFEEMRLYFLKKFNDNNKEFNQVPFITSFRSTKAILKFIDSVFGNEIYKKGLGNDVIEHQSFRKQQPGQVTLWPLFKNPEKVEKDVWAAPTQIIDSTSGAQALANYIGDKIQDWLNDKNRILHSYDRRIEAKDIMILLRTRNKFLDQLVRALKVRNIPVSGVDRMILNDQLVVQDLCAAAQFALLPDDDLTLAGLLKSPFIGIDEETLFDLSYNRKNLSLWDRVRHSHHKEIIDWLEHIITISGKESPYNFFSQILQLPCPTNHKSGLAAIKSRLGDEALDPIDEFINLVLNYEHKTVPSMQEFLVIQESNLQQIKRELDEAGNMVRIMTIHGAKGLQSPIVILPDTIRSTSSRKERLLLPQKTMTQLPYFCPTSSNLPPACAKAMQYLEDKETQEYRRLFYVAATRAESELYIAGNEAMGRSRKESWYDYARDTFETLDDVQPQMCAISEREIFHFTNPATTDEADKAGKNNLINPVKTDAPPWLYQKIKNTETPLKALTPSRPDGIDEEESLSPLSASNNNRFKRGNIIHKLLQILPDINPDLWEERIRYFLNLPAHDLSKIDQENILSETLKILNDPIFSPIFGKGSRAEVSITAIVNNKTLSGQIDRLLITNDKILIVDYKTNRPPPKKSTDIPLIYKNQMDAYEAALKQIYPDKQIQKALIWTNTATLMVVE